MNGAGNVDEADEPTPWCHGPPHTLSHVAENIAGTDGVYAITASEHPDGSGRSITVEINLDDPTAEELRNRMDTYSIWLEPPFTSHWGGIAECVIRDSRPDPPAPADRGCRRLAQRRPALPVPSRPRQRPAGPAAPRSATGPVGRSRRPMAVPARALAARQIPACAFVEPPGRRHRLGKG